MSYQYAARKNISRAQKRPPESVPAHDPLAGGINGSLPSSRRIDLPGALQSKMETAFGADFSSLKLYQSPAVSEAGDLAVAQGGSIAFAPDAPALTSRAGQELLGHELSHVVSQARGEVSGSGLLESAPLEARADREGAMAASGMQITAEAEPVSIGGAYAEAAPMQAKRKRGKRRGKAAARARKPKAPKITQSAPSSTAAEGESSPAAVIDAISGAAEGGAPEAAVPVEKAAPEAAAPEAAAEEAAVEEAAREKPSKGSRIGKMFSMGAGFLGNLAGTVGGVLGGLGFGTASTIVGGIGKGLGALGDFIGAFTGSGKKDGEEAGGEGGDAAAADQEGLAAALGGGDVPVEALAALAGKKKKG